ncbi:hypothetical protein ABB37_03430 [Leptomonas pyrrhocoris]|uniref:Uncharacterized protein n=1 Tax=Leptomonas pyrrhocoris TaxID=157538 RepID=A0A0M9G4N0_LEPPY|nr:hypothetical protein ABB37_03430 [Leptomonas pyrrhocoris]XP_015660780.1 hypothetical protein ABB37_03430 [Leptomonas pyrrhocoris]KPA82340.1 hypothetical protein ABB37_03430 [Leptomonas pyrrhocoris]KPA82341.1 hypothetical protein ABB37_03430 [Leptomonas pyrrhocoris]|eukprot:XP_015660779.1 hypothetical protein ABB37_03430 [Leptomonas pyrrhocoris]
MGDNPASPGSPQKAGSAQHQRIVLQKQLAEVRMENTILRQQLYQVSTLLDIAVSKLGTLGVSLETPIDIRALRAAALQHASAETAQAQDDTIGASPKDGDPTTGHNTSKKFQMRQQLSEHTKAVQCCAFSDREEPLIVTGGMDCRLIVHNHFTGEKLWDSTAHEEAVSDVAWFDHRCLLSASYDATVKLWDVNGGTSNKNVLYQYNAHGFVLSAIPLGPSLFACSDSRHKTAIVDVRVGGKGLVQDHEYRVNSLSYDESAKQLLMGQSNGVISIWDMRRPDQALQATPSGGNSAVTPPVAPSQPTAPPQRGGGMGGSSGDVAAVDAADVGDVPGANLNGVGAGAATGVTEDAPGASFTSNMAALNVTANTSGLGTSGNGGSGSAGGLFAGATRLARTTELKNEPSHSPISYIAHFHSDDDTRRLICVSGDNVVRLYRGNLNAFTAGRTEGANLYVLRNVMTGIPTRGNVMRSGFWKGERAGKSEVSVFFDDGEMDAMARPPRRLTECDVLVTGGPDNTAQVFDVTDEGKVVVLERLEGHRDRVTGATVRRSRKPIIATTSADSTVRIWVPVKS